MLIPARRASRERLDDPGLPSEEMVRSLQDIDLVNRRWGGSRAVAKHLLEHMPARGTPPPVRILDVGAGSGGVARRLAARLRAAGHDALVVASDLQWRHLAAGRRGLSPQPLVAAAADAFGLPFASRAFDWTISTLLFHHFTPAQNVRMLRELARVSRQGFALLDLRRHLFPLIFVEIAGRLLFRSRVSLEDGAASVRQAYTPAEALAIAQDAVPGARVEKVFPFRLLIWKNGSGSP